MNYLRNVVSGPKARHVSKGEGVDLDLVYLTDRIILMGYPASGFEASYRNKMSDVVAFLDSKHRDCYRVFNLCPTSENSYPPTSFHGRISRYPHPDHHPPPLPLLHAATQEMEAYLNASPGIGGKNVVVIHCKAGKGRTGTLACCLMERLGGVDAVVKEHGMLNGRLEVPGSREDELTDGEGTEGGSVTGPTPTPIAPSPSEEPSVVSNPPLALDTVTPTKKTHKSSKSQQLSTPPSSPPHPAAAAFAFHTARRMHNPQSVKQGVSIPSQRRFVRYFHSSLANLRSTTSSSPSTPSIYPGGSQHSSNPKPMLKLKDIIVTQTSSANASLTPKVRGEAARYLDSFVSMLDDKVTENAKLGLEEGGLKPILEGAGGLGIGMSGVGTDEVGGEGEKGGAGMVRSLSKLSESYVEVGAKDFDEYGEATKTPLVTHHLTPDSAIVVHPDRELKIQVLHGENTGRSVSSLRARGFKSAVVNVVLSQDTSSLGWIWLIPSFHLPPPQSHSPSQSSPEPRTHTITFPRELVDFRSKSLRSIQLVFEEMPAPSPAPSLNVTTGGEEEGKKGEVVPPEGERETADTKGINEADEGGEYK